MQKKTYLDLLIETLETRIRTASDERRQKRYAGMLLDARMKRLDQMTHELIVQEHASQFTKRVTGHE